VKLMDRRDFSNMASKRDLLSHNPWCTCPLYI
jgi:hypothetical protein